MTTPAVRRATLADLDRMADALAQAFHDDPVMAWLFRADRDRVAKLRPFFRIEGRRHLEHPFVYTTDDHAGAAYWDPPGRWRSSFRHLLRLGPHMTRALGPRVPRALRGVRRIEQAHDRHPDHYYLSVLGTRPDRQGSGVGSALLRPVLDRCDELGIGAYLESSKEANVPFYRRYGFEVVEEVHLPKGPTLWTMWRDPQAAVPAR